MKNELYKQFVKKTIRKVVMFTFLMIIVASIAQSMSPVISNELALTQMQNSNEIFVIVNTYNKVRPIANSIYVGIIIWFTYMLGRDVYKFVKTINVENEKEN